MPPFTSFGPWLFYRWSEDETARDWIIDKLDCSLLRQLGWIYGSCSWRSSTWFQNLLIRPIQMWVMMGTLFHFWSLRTWEAPEDLCGFMWKAIRIPMNDEHVEAGMYPIPFVWLSEALRQQKFLSLELVHQYEEISWSRKNACKEFRCNFWYYKTLAIAGVFYLWLRSLRGRVKFPTGGDFY